MKKKKGGKIMGKIHGKIKGKIDVQQKLHLHSMYIVQLKVYIGNVCLGI